MALARHQARDRHEWLAARARAVPAPLPRTAEGRSAPKRTTRVSSGAVARPASSAMPSLFASTSLRQHRAPRRPHVPPASRPCGVQHVTAVHRDDQRRTRPSHAASASPAGYRVCAWMSSNGNRSLLRRRSASGERRRPPMPPSPGSGRSARGRYERRVVGHAGRRPRLLGAARSRAHSSEDRGSGARALRAAPRRRGDQAGAARSRAPPRPRLAASAWRCAQMPSTGSRPAGDRTQRRSRRVAARPRRARHGRWGRFTSVGGSRACATPHLSRSGRGAVRGTRCASSTAASSRVGEAAAGAARRSIENRIHHAAAPAVLACQRSPNARPGPSPCAAAGTEAGESEGLGARTRSPVRSPRMLVSRTMLPARPARHRPRSVGVKGGAQAAARSSEKRSAHEQEAVQEAAGSSTSSSINDQPVVDAPPGARRAAALRFSNLPASPGARVWSSTAWRERCSSVQIALQVLAILRTRDAQHEHTPARR